MNSTKRLITLCLVVSCAASPLSANHHKSSAGSTVLSVADVDWEQLNPARGDQSPKAGTLWGDRKGDVATGFLTQFVDGFSSPPHIHNVTYRAVVIRGLIHNDDPDAANMWMPPGSFWTQPKGELHITSARGETNIAYVEIDAGPYLVMPSEQAFDSGERPVNVDPGNIVWLDSADATWVSSTGESSPENGPAIAFLWGAPSAGKLNGSFVRLPAGFTGKITTPDAAFRAIVVAGNLTYGGSPQSKQQQLAPGSYFGSEHQTHHNLRSSENEATILYIRATGKYRVAAE
ncbi:MAG: DUF4437 domain-containing protein [Synoicihabitans sp.]